MNEWNGFKLNILVKIRLWRQGLGLKFHQKYLKGKGDTQRGTHQQSLHCKAGMLRHCEYTTYLF